MSKTKNEMKTNGKYTFSDGYHLQKKMGMLFFPKRKLFVKKIFGLMNQEQIIESP
jgi:hypothetical protein